MTDVCVELQNIKYQTMLLNGNSTVVSTKTESVNISEFLNKEKELNENKPWSKLGKHIKIHLLFSYIERVCNKNECSEHEINELKGYMTKCLDRKKLSRAKDVIYDKISGKIKNIPGLSFDLSKRKYTLRQIDKKKTTLKEKWRPRKPGRTKNKGDTKLI
jgi:hypothetical protein